MTITIKLDETNLPDDILERKRILEIFDTDKIKHCLGIISGRIDPENYDLSYLISSYYRPDDDYLVSLAEDYLYDVLEGIIRLTLVKE